MCQVQFRQVAEQAVAAGADILVVQGNEAGGHIGTMDLMPLLTWAADRFPDVPLMAAGGISTGRGLAAVLAAGADGVWMGTAFLATPECVEVPDAYKDLLIRSNGEDTMYTRVFDILSGLPWGDGIGARLLRNKFLEEWHGREDELIERHEELRAAYMAARESFDYEKLDIGMGEGVGAITAIRPAAEVLRSICDDAERLLRERAGLAGA
jgi:nitronate monooxygenase